MPDIETESWKEYQHGLAYLGSSGLSTNIPNFVKFYEGDQWPAATEATRNMPRAMVNIVKMICRSKRASILSTPVRIVYKGETKSEDVRRWNEFANYISKEIQQDAADKQAIFDATVKGTYVYHYYWDKEARGKDGIRNGGLRVEVIDPLQIFFADPTQVDEQKQKWIIIASREEVSSVRAKADNGVNIDAIVADKDENNKYDKKEQDGTELCTVLTKYFRQDGEVYIEKSVRGCVVNKAFRLAPEVEKMAQEIESAMPLPAWEQPKKKRKAEAKEDAPNNTTPDSIDAETLIDKQVRAGLYPIVVGQYEPKQGSIYGQGEAQGVIPNQKIINFILSMYAFNVQENAWGKWLVLPTALGKQKISNLPGQVLIDNSGTGNGIKKLSEQPIQSSPMTLVDSIMSMTRVVSGATEVITGEVIGANMSGAAIASLQAQANMPVEELRDTWWRVKVKQGRVLAQFYKLFYEGAEFVYEGKPFADDAMAMMPDKDGMHVSKFYGSQYIGRDFDVAVEVTGGSKATVASDIAALDAMYQKGAIDLKTYIDCYPDEMLSNKNMILNGIEASQQTELAQVKMQCQDLQAKLTEAAQIIAEQNDTVNKVENLINENRRLKATLANVYTEANNYINEANKQMMVANEQIAQGAESMADAEMFAKELQRREQQ